LSTSARSAPTSCGRWPPTPRRVSDEQIRDLAWLQTAFLAVEAEMRRAEREVLHEEVQERTSSIPYQNA
jgi:hypothetical protein